MNNVMLDLETMGLGPTAAIIALGAVRFTTAGVVDSYYRVVDLQSSVDLGLTMDASTVVLWLGQSGPAREAIRRKGTPILEVLENFAGWLEVDPGAPHIWGNGAAFDNVVLANAYRLAGQKPPWSYKHDRCYRTIAAMAPEIERVTLGTAHNALDDARSQAEHLITIQKAVDHGSL